MTREEIENIPKNVNALLDSSVLMPTRQKLDEKLNKVCEMAIKALEILPKYKDAYGKGWDDGAKATYEHVKICEEEKEPKTGHWIVHDVPWYICSECGCYREMKSIIEKYCPNCGKRMSEETE